MDFVLVISILLAFIVKGVCGFANTLVFGSIMSFNANTINITPIDLLVGVPSNFLLVIKERKSVKPGVFIPLSLLVIAGIIPGVIFLKNGNAEILKMVFGFAVILIGVETLLRERQKKVKKQSKFALAVIGIISGILCGLFGVGAFLVAYIGRTTENQSQFRGNICAVFLVENIFRIILYSVSGIITMSVFITSMKLIPIMLIGLFIGIMLSKVIKEETVKKIVIIMLMLTGVSLVISNMLNLMG